MDRNLTARASTTIHAPSDAVWQALVDPARSGNTCFGAQVDSDWREGSPITWKGEFKGKPYEDKGKILEVGARQAPALQPHSQPARPACPTSPRTTTR
jgi:uncharacterized protein YndB with AHSA1/START domain